jgi:uncharacterized protein (DUF2147 family)
MLRILAAAVLCVVGGSFAAQAQASPEGYWVDEDNSFVVEVARCGAHLCGEIVGLQPSDAHQLDVRNSDKTKRQRSWCGLDVMGNLKQSPREAGKWEGGWVYNPKDGKTYSSEMRLDGPDRLKVRGYVLGPMFGKNLNLYRENSVTFRCPDRRS